MLVIEIDDNDDFCENFYFLRADNFFFERKVLLLPVLRSEVK